MDLSIIGIIDFFVLCIFFFFLWELNDIFDMVLCNKKASEIYSKKNKITLIIFSAILLFIPIYFAITAEYERFTKPYITMVLYSGYFVILFKIWKKCFQE